MKYNWQQSDWPHFSYNQAGLESLLLEFSERDGRADGMLEGLPDSLQKEAQVDLMILEALKTSQIEGEYLSRKDIASSIKRNLGLVPSSKKAGERKAIGIADVMTDVRETFKEPLSKKMLFRWHKRLMDGSSGVSKGAYRIHNEPMQIVSGVLGKEKIHFEAPPSCRVSHEMEQFIEWFNSPDKTPALIRSALCHLYFETIHPFEDGNGRIGRALSKKMISIGIGRPAILSLSKVIEENRREYYRALEKAQLSNEVTEWLQYFCNTALEAQKYAEKSIAYVIMRVKFFDELRDRINPRQEKALQRMFEAGPEGFEGGMTSKKYISLTGASKATATRDLQELLEIGALRRVGAGRSTRYDLNI